MMEESNWEEVVRLREQLNSMLCEDLTGYKVRSKFQSGPEYERSSIFHAAKEFKNFKNVNSGLRINGSVIRDRNRIEAEVTKFFNALFNGHHGRDLQDTGVPFVPDWRNLNSLLENVGKISDIQKDQLVSDITKEELDFIVENCPTMKSPGLDGLTYEFYKKVWDIIGNRFLQVLQVQLDRLKLIESNRMGATKLVPKVDDVPRVDELRPITLLNTDYKLLTKWMVFRLKPLMGSIIKSGQICNVDGKNILFGAQNILSSIEYVKKRKLGAALVSLDFFKAYDRLFLPFLIKVLEKMNFGGIFCNWVKMLHHNAKTRFILSFLTKEIEVNFSVRQGDPLAMLLYVIYVEPFLLLLEKRLSGLIFSSLNASQNLESFKQVSEAFCDDINLIITKNEDFQVVGRTVCDFEVASGAILSRNKKCLVLGLGSWKNRHSWILEFLQPVKVIKVFGIWIMDNYRQLLSYNWNKRIENLRKAIFSWAGRYFETIKQRIIVMNCFALSRIFYTAAVLPITKAALKTINSLVIDFLWKRSGKFLKVARDEVVNMESKGGLALLDTEAMCNSLIVSQSFRLMKSTDVKSQSHLKFWMSEFLEDIWEGPDDCAISGNMESEHFNEIAGLISNVRLLENMDISLWRSHSNKSIYTKFAESFVKPKVERESSWDMCHIWRRLNLLKFTPDAHEVAYLMIHNKLPLRERLFRFRLASDPYCQACSSAEIEDTIHYFITCERVQYYWKWVRRLCIRILNLTKIEDKMLLKFYWPTSRKDRDISWLISHFIFIVWDMLGRRKLSYVNEREFFGFLKFRYRKALVLNAVSEVDMLL